MTSLTTKWACQNKLNKDMSWTMGAAWATSAGFIRVSSVYEHAQKGSSPHVLQGLCAYPPLVRPGICRK
jgi:hypothetical protein